MRVFGIIGLRDSATTVRVVLLHHLSLGLERIFVLDNGSTDATPKILRRLARRIPITVIRDDGPFRQDELMTGLLHEATRAGADWVVPFDDDEFLVSDEPFRVPLGRVRRDGILVPVVNFVQHRSRRRKSPRGLLSMTMRPEHPVEASRAVELGSSGRLAVVETEWPRKIILRGSLDARMENGNHGAQNVGELEFADWCRFLHAPILSPEALSKSADQGRRIRELRDRHAGWQHFLMADEADAGRLDEQWRLNSWDGEHAVGPGRSALVRDTALADTVRPWVRSPAAQLAARIARRSY